MTTPLGIEDLRSRAAAGDGQAAVALGARLLVGDDAPFSPEEGANWLARAADAGAPEGHRLTATLAAAGIGRPQGWSEALDRLETGAALGEPACQAQLRLLAACPDGITVREVPAGASWRALRDAVDVAAWTAAVERRPVCEAPRIREVDRFLAPNVCDWLIAAARGRLERATMYNPASKRNEPHPGRTNSTFLFDVRRADVVVALVRARIAATVKIPLPCFEPTQVFHYAPGQTIAGHYDYLEAREMTRYGTGERYDGQRIATFLIYLNDDYQAGETIFPKVGYSFKGRRGSALFFANVDAAGEPERLSLHAGAPPTGGDKWIISQWIHNQPFTGMD